MNRSLEGVFSSPLFAALLFLGSVLAAASLTTTFWLVPPLNRLLVLAPLALLVFFAFAQWRFVRRAEAAERALLFEAVQFAAIITVSVLGLGELFALLGARLWDPREIWHWVVLLACLLGTRRARSHRA